MNRPSFSPAVFIFKWSGNNLSRFLKKIIRRVPIPLLIIEKNYLNNFAQHYTYIYIIISNDTFYENIPANIFSKISTLIYETLGV